MLHDSPSSPTVTILHPDETLLDLLQYELEQAGTVAHAVQLDSAAPVELLLPYLPATTDACIVGLGQPLAYTHAVLALVQPWLGSRPLLGLSASPALLQNVFGTTVTAYVQESADPEQTAGVAVSMVRRWLGRPARPPLVLPALGARAAQACTLASQAIIESRALRATARALRHAPVFAPGV